MTAGRVVVVWDDQAGHWSVTITPPGGSPVSHPMAADRGNDGTDWPMPHPSTRPAARRSAGSWSRTGDAFRKLAHAVEAGNAKTYQAVAYGRHLFDALLGPEGWATLDTPVAGHPQVIELSWGPGPLHRFVWELMHDGHYYLALRPQAPAAFVRLVKPPGAAGGTGIPGPVTITRPPRVLFAVGSPLDDWQVRAGAEVMGLLREFERDSCRQGTAVQARVLTNTSLARLRRGCEELDPDVVHLIGHGRWDGGDKVGKLTLTSDSADLLREPQADESESGEEHTAAALADAMGVTLGCMASGRSGPTLVVVSACDGGVASTGVGLPLGAELAASGVPIVIAMAGAISDTACRVFTRSVVASVARGKDFTEALATGRFAAFAYAKNTPQYVDWALPAIFLRAELPEAFKLADPQAMEAVRNFIRVHDHIDNPLFAGRHELLDDLDALLGQGNPGVLVLHSTYPRRVGGTRALRELAAEAIRKGHLPVRIGSFLSTDDAPTTFPALARAIAGQIVQIAKGEEQLTPPRRTLLLLTGYDPDAPASAPGADGLLELPTAQPAPSAGRLVDTLRNDLFALQAAMAARHPGVFRDDAAPVLLLDDVHLYTDGLARLCEYLKPTGLGVGPKKLPVVLFVKEHETAAGQEMLAYREGHQGQGPLEFRELQHLTDLPGGAYQLALLSWLLNPPDVKGWPKRPVLAPKGNVEPGMWLDAFKNYMRDRNFYDPISYGEFADYVVKYRWFEAGEDDAILRAYGMLS